MSVLLSSNTIRASLKRSSRLRSANHHLIRLLAIETKNLTSKPKSLDDVYTKIISKSDINPNGNEMYFASTTYDQVLTRLDAEILQTWSLYEACLESGDYERADLILQNIATHKSNKSTYFFDAVCEFLKTWGIEDSNSMEEIRRWLKYVFSLNRNFIPDARVYAWLIKLQFKKSNDVEDAYKLLTEYFMLQQSNKNADVLRYVDIIGLLNIKKLVDYKPKLADDLTGNYKSLFIAMAEEKSNNESKLTSDSHVHNKQLDESSNNNELKTENIYEPVNIELQEQPIESNNLNLKDNSDIQDISLDLVIKEKEEIRQPTNKVIDNKMENLKSVSSENLKNIRHSLLGLVDSYNDGQFLKKMIQLIELEKLDIDTKALTEQAKDGTINLFELKNSLPLEQHDKFDEILDNISEIRERVLESSTLEAAKLKWEREFENIKDKSLPSPVGAYLHDWLKQLIPLIDEEVKGYRKAREIIVGSKSAESENLSKAELSRLKEKLTYGPFLELMKSPKLATIAILDSMKSIVTSDINRGVPVSKLVIGIGKGIELEYKSEKILAADVDVHKNFKAIKNTPEFKKFLRSSKAAQIVDNVEKSAMNHNNISSESNNLSWDSESLCRIGSLLLSFLLQIAKIEVKGVDPRTGETKTALAPAFYHTYDFQNGGRIGVIKLNQGFANRLGKDRLDQSIQAQYLPMVCKPKPWTTYNDGGYFLKRVTVLRAKNAPEQAAYAKAAAINGKVDRVLQGLNNLGNTSWTVNKRLLEVITKVWNTGEKFLEIPKAEENLVLPPAPQKGCDAIDVFRYRRTCTEICNEFSKDRSMRCDMNYKLEIARAFVGERIFFPHSLDFRGRAYPVPPNFNHLGNDMSRSLLKFWKGKELGPNGLRWLKIHLSNLMGKDKISLDERAAFIEENIELIRDSVKDPLGGQGWWKKADKPWQFLASSIELIEALELADPTKYVSFQPIHQDGTCNGLQHYAALGGDLEGARQVNLIPAERPSDVYTHVANSVLKTVLKDKESGIPEAELTLPIIARKIVKQTVMTSVYGVTYVGARAQITKRLKEIEFDEDAISNCSKYLTERVFKAIRELFDGAHAIQDWLALAARRISKSVRLDVEPEEGDEFISSVIWTSPLGLPVVQPYRSVKNKLVKTNMQTFVIQDPYGIKKVDGRKQANGFPPNFIHSLDATHMLLSVNKCSEYGLSFSSVHDSYWTHACDVDIMNHVLREEFINLHSNNLIEKLKGEFERRYEGFLMVVSVDKNTPVALAVKKYRDELAKKIGKAPTFTDEIKIERERRILLASKDPADVILGKKLKTSITVLDDIGYKHDTIDDNTGVFKILVPFTLPDIPPKGKFDVSVVQDSPYFFS
ncbi:DNA-directed RNA polymerase [Pichia californica]|uniref:DNA-directed RNA polymerase n=1 Tax=Pichia californica TaxID=460514 RepID=A0A9P6WN77_9ASCO|nr:DNA-directed RNA polymerase [[Candida] californica]KAG0689197.1 DNA-directed RNA polymerase [[Candida] californica]